MKKFKKKLIVLNVLLIFCLSNFIQFVDINTPNSLIEKRTLDKPSPKLNNQNINITTPENKTYTTSMGGYYPATYGFEWDENNDFPKGWYENSGSNGYAKVIDGIGGHNKVLECYSSSSGDSRVDSIIFFDPQEHGLIEFWWYKSSSYSSAAIVDFWGETPGACVSIRVDHNNDKVEYQPGGGYLDTGYSYYTDNKWMHFRIDFDCSSDTYSLWIDQVLYLDNIDFIDSKDETGVNQMRFDSYNEANAVLYYVDAVSFSWDPNYDIWDNLNEGLLLSFTNSTMLDWIGYSLDSQSNKTIFGNTTIPMPEEGIHSIQVFGEILGTTYQSDKRYFTLDYPIKIISPEAKTYKKAMDGYYPATYGFETIKNGSIPEGWTFISTDPAGESFVIDEVDEHKNVLKLKHGGTISTYTRLRAPLFDPIVAGSVEWWMYYEDNALNHGAAVSINKLFPWESLTAVGLKGDGSIMYYDGGIQSFYGTYSLDTWHHFKLDFDCSTDKFNLTFNGNLILSDIDFTDDLDNVDELHFQSDQLSNPNVYYDAIGYSWESGYNIGDNLDEGLLLSFENSTALDWVGYSLDNAPVKTILGNATIPLPNDGEHIIKVVGNDSFGVPHRSPFRRFSVYHINIITPEDKTYDEPMGGYYPATYGFESDDNNDIPEEWSSWVSMGNAQAKVISTKDGHNKVVELNDITAVGQTSLRQTLNENRTFGTIEFWFYITDITQKTRLVLGEYQDTSFELFIESSKWQYLVGVTPNDVPNVTAPQNDQWTHIRIDYEYGTGGYQGLSEDEWYIIIDGVNSSALPATYAKDKMNWIDFISSVSASGFFFYIDAIGYSWNPYYNIGDNLDQGLLLSYENSTALNVTGYSLNYQPIKTIRGNTTLRIPDGDHTIQIFGNDTSGTNYKSDIRQFSVYHINITTPENKTYYEPMNGYYPATYGFENDDSGSVADNWLHEAVASTHAYINDSAAGRNKVYELYDNQGSGNIDVLNQFSNQSYGTVDFWLYVTSDGEWTTMDIRDDTTETAVMQVVLTPGQYLLGRNSTGDHNFTEFGIMNGNEWYHFRVDFRRAGEPAYMGLADDTYIVTLNENQANQALGFMNTGLPINQFSIGTAWSGFDPNYYCYLDAVGYSWDPYYNIGDNLNEGLLLSFENSTALDWTGYSLNSQSTKTIMGNVSIPMPEIGLHTIQVFGNDSTGTMYNSDLRYFRIDSPLKIITPENKTYNEPTSGYYPATYGFENDVSNEIPTGWENYTYGYPKNFIEVRPEFNGHKNVLMGQQLGAGAWNLLNYFNEAEATIEFWVACTNDTSGVEIYLANNSYLDFFHLFFDSGDIVLSTNQGFNRFDTYILNTWYHIRIDFRSDTGNPYQGLNQNEYEIYINGNSKGNFSYNKPGTPDHIQLIGGNGYFDAFGYSWDPNYNIGDNLNEGLLLSFENYTNLEWQGYSLDGQPTKTILGNTTIPIPGKMRHTIQVYGNDSMGTNYQSEVRHFSVDINITYDLSIFTPENKTYSDPMSGYYPATFGFEDDKGRTDTSISFVDGIESGSNVVNVSEELDGHKDYLDYQDDNYFYNNFSSQTMGYIDFWIRTETLDSINGDQLWISVRDSTQDALTLQFFNGEITSLEDGTPSPGWYFYSVDTWYHIKILFNCSSEKYSVWINDILVRSEKDFAYSSTYNYSAGVEELRFDSYYSPVRRYFDAIGYSWDSSYNVGDNLNEGLLLSYGNYTNLEWQGYSLDGQPIKRIPGNTTIPMPGDGKHSIQVFANDPLGYNYLSDIRYFTVSTIIDITNPIIVINSPSFNALFGSSAPFFNLTITEPNLQSMWHTLDGGLTNTTITGQIGIIDQTVWNNAPNGTTIIRFYANDEAGNTGFAEVDVRKDILSPIITIDAPSENGVFPETAPDFDLSISDGNLDSIWYSLDGGLTNTLSSLPTGTIDQTVWGNYLNGTVTIRFFANDTIGNIGFEEITIGKDILEPEVIILNPSEGDKFGGTAPFFNLSIIDGNLDLGAIWYTLDDSPFNLPCDASGQISQQLWNALPSGSYVLTFYASDVFGHEGFSQVTIIKRGGGQAIYGYDNLLLSLILIMGIVSIGWQIRKKIK